MKCGILSFGHLRTYTTHRACCLCVRAPVVSMRSLCAYGVAKPTERGYFFKRNPIYDRQPSVPYVIDADTSYSPLNIYKGVRCVPSSRQLGLDQSQK